MKQELIEQATEELWAKIIDMAETEELSWSEWLEIIESIRKRLLLSSDASARSN
jgi:hypothetical protein